MKTVKLLLVLGLIYWVSIQSRCKKEDPLPCSQSALFKADFVIGETVQDSLVETDTIQNIDFQVTIKASAKYDSIKWQVGDDPRDFANQQTVKLTFKPQNAGQTFKVTLFAKGKADPTCPLPPNDDGLDTIVKSFTVGCNKHIGGCTSTNLTQTYIGKWRGAFEDEPSQQFDVQIVDFGPDPNTNDNIMFYDIRIYNLPKGCGGIWLPNNYSGCGGDRIDPSSLAYPIVDPYFKGFYTSTTVASSCCPGGISLFGKVEDKDRNKIVIYLQYKSTSVKKVFRGIRI